MPTLSNQKGHHLLPSNQRKFGGGMTTRASAGSDDGRTVRLLFNSARFFSAKARKKFIVDLYIRTHSPLHGQPAHRPTNEARSRARPRTPTCDVPHSAPALPPAQHTAPCGRSAYARRQGEHRGAVWSLGARDAQGAPGPARRWPPHAGAGAWRRGRTRAVVARRGRRRGREGPRRAAGATIIESRWPVPVPGPCGRGDGGGS